MNTNHAVDIYSNFVTDEITFIRRRDGTYFMLPNSSDAKRIGHAAFEAIEPSISNELPWKKTASGWSIEWDDIDIVVAIRNGGQLIIGTPYSGWGKAPDIKINNQPTYLDFGNAILQQLQYVKAKREENA